MINQDDVFPIGQINKPHGINGEMSFSFTTDIFDSKKIPYLIIQTEGIYVPFYIESYRSKSNETGLIKLEGINNEEKARLFAGQTIYLPKYAEMQNIMGDSNFAVTVTIIAHPSNTANFILTWQNASSNWRDNNGSNWVEKKIIGSETRYNCREMGPGDVLRFVLIGSSENDYWGQLLEYHN